MCRLQPKELLFPLVSLLLAGLIAAAPLLERSSTLGSMVAKESQETVDSDSETFRSDVEIVGIASSAIDADFPPLRVYANWLSVASTHCMDGAISANSQRGPPVLDL
jgi:hypothetical protein